MRGKELVINLSDGVASLTQFESSPHGREVVRRTAHVLPEGADSAELASQVASLAADADMASERTGLLLDGAGVLVREFAFPFSAPSKVQRAVQFEMEGGLPVKDEDLAGGVLLHRESRGCRVFSFSLRKQTLAAHLDALAEAGMDPDLVGVDLAALASFAQRLPGDAGPLCILDAGFGRTLLAVVDGGAVRGLARRECGVGEAVDARPDCSRQDVLDGAFPDEDFSGPELDAAADRMERAARQLALSCGVEPGALLLCGAGAELPGLAQALADRSGLVVKPVWAVADAGDMGLAEEVDPILVGALEDSGLMGARRDGTMNLRQGEFARRGDPRGLARRYSWFAAMGLLLLVALGAATAARGLEEHRRVRAAEARITQLFQDAVPDVQGEFSRTQMFSILQTRIDRLRGRRDKGGERARTKAIEVVRGLNTAAPAKLDVEVDTLTVGDDAGRIRGTARDFQAVNTFLEALSADGVLADVRIVVASSVKKSGRVRYELEYARK